MNFLISLAFLCSFSALACPKLEGNFKSCQSSVPGADLFYKIKKVTQERVDGETIFAVTYGDTPLTERTEFYLMDGRPHVVETDPRLGSRSVRTSTGDCSDTEAELHIVREIVTPLGRKITGDDRLVLSLKSSVITNRLSYKTLTTSGDAVIICQ